MPIPHPFMITFAVALAATAVLVPFLVRKLDFAGFVGVDLNKVRKRFSKPELERLKRSGFKGLPTVPRAGGIAMVFGYCAAILLSLWLLPLKEVPLLLAGLLAVCLVSMIGIIEDFLPVRQVWRMLLPAFAALPLIFIGAGNPAMVLPFVGEVNFGLAYFFVLVPIGVIAASNLVNLLAGFNGIEAGTGAVAAAALFLIAYMQGRPDAAFLAAALFGVCAAFLLFNWFPAKIFPGNSGTYLIGGAIAAIVVIGNMEKAGMIVLAPQIVEFFFKAGNWFRAENFGVLQKDGTLKHDGPAGSLTHLAMRLHLTEPQLTALFICIQFVFGALAVLSTL
ncbi:MAG: hypothetical protein NTY90_00955 [Candidatus Micrarchaeota archaeon]|nr:hypothetical protein [Candidatus Micrarchaeota archaeon]